MEPNLALFKIQMLFFKNDFKKKESTSESAWERDRQGSVGLNPLPSFHLGGTTIKKLERIIEAMLCTLSLE